uniref:Immunoglobulin domain-containing protein n=1 Tax=Nothoprocta perdicaria TaxID=30464 RepID=A0A8C6YY06_NOTPE
MLEGLLLWTWLLLPGCQALTGPAEASGPLGGTLVVTCAYEAEQAEAEKYWCRGHVWLFCSVLVAAAGAEASAERLRLRDERARRLFTVTMQNLTAGDGDTYWCGIRQPWHDAMVPVVVTVLPGEPLVAPGLPTAPAGPQRVRGGGSWSHMWPPQP